MQVKEIMSREVIVVQRSTTLKELLKIFRKFHIFPLVPVVENDKHLVGIVSFRNLIDIFSSYHPDVLKLVPFLDEEEADIFKIDITEDIGYLVVVVDVMEKEFLSISEDASIEEVYKLMRLHLKEEFPVVDKTGKLTGMVGIFDVIQAVFRQKGIIK
ncbi:MAG: CBS domain-containing protein [Candidatus Omnitrophica bacterium]|nr:CBS domain-containing protein [Candidatus Omnitrophota bacterium]